MNHTEAFLEPDTQYDALVYLYTGVVTRPFPFEVKVLQRFTDVFGLYYDILTPLEALDVLNENTTEYRQILTHLERAVNLVDTRVPHSEGFFASVAAAREFLKTEFYEGVCTTEGKPVVHCIGHTHIDVEWKWHRAQTREKMQRSFASANALMEKYPEYLFTLSQPELYRYLKEEAPEKYEELKQLESIYLQLNDAFYNEDEYKMKILFNEFINILLYNFYIMIIISNMSLARFDAFIGITVFIFHFYYFELFRFIQHINARRVFYLF